MSYFMASLRPHRLPPTAAIPFTAPKKPDTRRLCPEIRLSLYTCTILVVAPKDIEPTTQAVAAATAGPAISGALTQQIAAEPIANAEVAN